MQYDSEVRSNGEAMFPGCAFVNYILKLTANPVEFSRIVWAFRRTGESAFAEKADWAILRCPKPLARSVYHA